VRVWRGPEAPPPPERAEPLQGQISRNVIDSHHLSERRDLTVYLPPGHDPTQTYPVVYAADGQSVARFAAVLEPEIVEGSVPAVIVVGVHSAANEDAAEPYDSTQDLRAQEYLLGENPKRFEAHERFFVYEVSAWAERALGASSERRERAVFGCSNGGAFAVSMGVRHAERYDAVIAFSLGEGLHGWGAPQWTVDDAPHHYLLAGTLEPFQRTTARWAARLSRLGVEYVHRERVSGHDMVMWEEEFPDAVAWAFRR
jgi:enterochelin esterase-like enzyme